MKKKSFAVAITTGLFIFLLIPTVFSAGLVPDATGKGCDQGNATYCGNYTVGDFTSLAVRIAEFILGIVGSLSLVMFIYGGVTFLISAGSSEKIKSATNIITASVIGLVIVFASYFIINFAFGSIGLSWSGNTVRWK